MPSENSDGLNVTIVALICRNLSLKSVEFMRVTKTLSFSGTTNVRCSHGVRPGTRRFKATQKIVEYFESEGHHDFIPDSGAEKHLPAKIQHRQLHIHTRTTKEEFQSHREGANP